MKKFFTKKYFYIPALLLIYAGVMVGLYGPEWVKTGHSTKLILFIIVDLVIISLAFIFLRKRDKINDKYK